MKLSDDELREIAGPFHEAQFVGTREVIEQRMARELLALRKVAKAARVPPLTWNMEIHLDDLAEQTEQIDQLLAALYSLDFYLKAWEDL